MNDKEKLIHSYYSKELKEAHRILLLGSGTFALGILLYIFGGVILRHAALPLMLIAAVQIGSASVQWYSSKKILASRFKAELVLLEIPKMEKVVLRFQKFRTLLLIIFLVGFFLMLAGGIISRSPFLLGSGIGLVIQAALILILDLYGEFRANEYLRRLKK